MSATNRPLPPGPLRDELTAQGYRELREVPGRGACGVMPMMFTVGLFHGLTASGYDARYCYPPAAAAEMLAALHAWDGSGHPLGPWIKHKGDGVDEHNPATETERA